MTEKAPIRTRRKLVSAAAVATLVVAIQAQPGIDRGGIESIEVPALREWLTYIASDELQGREVYTEGLGLAASYIAEHLEEWGVKPGVADGTYFQTVKVLGVNSESSSSVTVSVNGLTRTFSDGEGVTFPRNMGGPQTVSGDEVMFVGYGLELPSAGINDYEGIDTEGKILVWLGPSGPRAAEKDAGRLLALRSHRAVEKGARAVIAPPSGRTRGRSGGGGRGGRSADFTTAQRYDAPITPVITASDEFFEFLFSGSETSYAELKALAAQQEPLPRFPLKNVTLTIDVRPEYSVVTTRLSRNVVGVIEGTDPALKDTYVAFGAHYDHIGYYETPPAARAVENAGGCTGQSRPEPRPDDIINNGADDDGSGTVALMAIARAFARGPKPKRSLLFVWHTGEESGLQGSRYNADHPVVPNDKIIAQLNVDMIGRNRCDRESESNTVYLVGSDRISTELHNLSEDVNASMPRPMTLDYELNDPADPESLYTRSDHYSYAAKGIPVIFYTTGLHRDYHYLTDEVDKIDFEKMARITRLIYATGERLANLDHAPVRDNKGPRAVKGSGKLQ